jgi:hypothetical protein
MYKPNPSNKILYAKTYPFYLKYDDMLDEWVKAIGVLPKYDIAILEDRNKQYFHEVICKAERALRYCFTRV